MRAIRYGDLELRGKILRKESRNPLCVQLDMEANIYSVNVGIWKSQSAMRAIRYGVRSDEILAATKAYMSQSAMRAIRYGVEAKNVGNYNFLTVAIRYACN